MLKKAISIILLLLTMMMCAVQACAEFSLRGYDQDAGYQYISLGRFPQEADGSEKPILWRVLSVEENQAYLLSEYVLFNSQIHSDYEEYVRFGGIFNQTDIFLLLNGPFEGKPVSLEEQQELRLADQFGYAHIAKTCFKDQAFTAQEQSMLIEDDALGMVFFVDAEDLKNKAFGFGAMKQRRAVGTAYALANGLFQYKNETSPYWTRSPSTTRTDAARCTKIDGDLGYIRCVVMNEGCRPAVRLILAGLEPVGGSGTMEDPYRFIR